MLNFIINPNSGGERGYKLWKTLEHYLVKKKIAYKAYITDGVGDAARIAGELTDTDEEVCIIAVGGDGIANEIVDGARISPGFTMGYIPTGSGNDLARGLKLPKSPKRCLKHILKSKEIKEIDYGILSYGKGCHRRFIVSSGIGYDAKVCHDIAERRKLGISTGFLLKKFIYIASGIKCLLKTKPVKGYVIFDGEKKIEFNNIVLVASHNHPTEGGGFRFAPKADNTDGELSVCIIHHKSKLKLVKILLGAMFGNHMKYAGVRNRECREIKIHTEIPLAVHTDGEVVGMYTDVELRCIGQKLRFIV